MASAKKSTRLSENPKYRERKLELYLSKKSLDELMNYVSETEDFNIIAEFKVQKIQELKKATDELIKNWDDAVVNVTKRRRDELLNRGNKRNAERTNLAKKYAEDKALEQANMIKEARKLVMHRKPQSRVINAALMKSEHYRQLNRQVALNKSIKSSEQQEKKVWAAKIRKDAEDYKKEKQAKLQKHRLNIIIYRKDLDKQVKSSESLSKKLELKELESGQKYLNSLKEGLERTTALELRESWQQKLKIQKAFQKTLEEKKLQDERFEKEQDREYRRIEVYWEVKEHLNKLFEKSNHELRDQKMKITEIIANKCAGALQSRETAEKERYEREQKDKEKVEREKSEAKRKYHEEIQKGHLQSQVEYDETKRKLKEKRENTAAWETHQRIKQSEYDKIRRMKEIDEIRKKKTQIANDIKRQVAELQAAREEEEKSIEDFENTQMALENVNLQILEYGQQVLEDSIGIRPLAPIMKALKTIKKEHKIIEDSLKAAAEKKAAKKKAELRKKFSCQTCNAKQSKRPSRL